MDPGLGKIFDPRVSPVAVDNLAFYGDEEVKIWFHTSGQLWKEMTDFAVTAEWNDLKACIKRTNFRPLDTLTLWQRMFTEGARRPDFQGQTNSSESSQNCI